MAWNCFRKRILSKKSPRPNSYNLVTKSYKARSQNWASLRWRTKCVTLAASCRCRSKGRAPLRRSPGNPPTIIETQWKAHLFHSKLLPPRLLENVYLRKIKMLQISLSKNYGQQFVSRILLFQSSHCLSLPYFWRKVRVSGATPLIQMRKWQNRSLSEASSFSTQSTAGVEGGETNTCLDKKLLQKTMTK